MSTSDAKAPGYPQSADGSEDHERYVANTPDVINKAKKPAAGAPANGGTNGLIQVQPIRKADMQPSFQTDNVDPNTIAHGTYGSMIHSLGACLGVCGAIPCCPMANPFKEIPQGSVGLVSRFGSFYAAADPGLRNVNICSESVKVVDVRIQLTPIPRQSVMTRDNVSVSIDSVLCWHITSPYRAVYGVADVHTALSERAQTTLRQVVGSRTLQTIVTEREAIAAEIAEIVEQPASHWGVAVESILIKDILFSKELQESLSAAATAKRIGESKVIAARAEVDSAKLMRQAADILASPAAMNIRTLEAMQAMARSANSKVIFVPAPFGSVGNPMANTSAAGGSNNFSQIANLADENYSQGQDDQVFKTSLINSVGEM